MTAAAGLLAPRVFRVVLGMLLALTVALAAPPPGRAEAQSRRPVRIGALVPLTGDLAAYGQAARNGILLAVEEINQAGGVLGRTLQPVFADTQTAAQVGVDAANRLVTVDGVIGIVGAFSSGVTVPVATSVASVYGVVMISPASTAPTLTTLVDNDFLFRTVASDALQGQVLARAARARGYRSVSVLYVNNDYGQGLAEAFEKAFSALGGRVWRMAAYEPGNASYRSDLRAVAGGEGLLLVGYPENGTTILRQALEEGFFRPGRFLFTDGMKAPEIIAALGARALEGAIGTAATAPPESGARHWFTRRYEERFRELPPKPYIDASYDAAFLIALAAEAAGSLDRTAIRDALRRVANPPGEKVGPGDFARARELLRRGADIDYVGASGDHNFDAAGDTTAGWFEVWAIRNGQIVQEEVVDAAATRPPVSAGGSGE